MGTFYVPNESGDARISWDPDVEAEVEIARRAFALWRDKGYRAYRVARRGKTEGEEIKYFDPLAPEILFLAPIAGGRR